MNDQITSQECFVMINNEVIKYFWKLNPYQKKLILKIRKAEIYVSSPPWVDVQSVENLIKANYQKINQLKTKFAINNKYDLFTTNPWILVFDQRVNLVLVEGDIRPKMVENQIYIKNYHDQDEQLKKLYNFLARYYYNWFLKQTKNQAVLMDLTFKNLTVKNLVGKWGACYPDQAKLIFNAKLLHFPIEVINCVVIHELAHLVHPNHSRSFWNLVYQYQPDYLLITKNLNDWGI
ncbi:hypothetical protein LD123_00126 [Mesoplasma sp. JKS002659]|uniref:YgjP-like metallopeptidase domain-containing protein n=2 Tax=Mesoplasma whartonense TaxID=2878854 RepID=UPI002022A1FC|nr:YgjP-like metallopeptidase domain-containing protein [Mesoplasma sp. JKS002657]MCL8215194.1 hypothetical protein [Mesoplasma sp. JKS002659]